MKQAPSKQKPSATPTKTETKPAQNAKQATPAKAETKPAQNAKQATPAADKPLDKKQLFINSIKESVSVGDLKTLYPKASNVKMQKRKVGKDKASIQYVSKLCHFSF